MESTNSPDYQDDEQAGSTGSPDYTNNNGGSGHEPESSSDSSQARFMAESGDNQSESSGYPAQDMAVHPATDADQTTASTTPSAGRRQLSARQKAFVVLGALVFALIVVGGIGISSGFFTATPAADPAGQADLTPPDPATKRLDGDTKYENPFGTQQSDLNPVATGAAGRSSELLTGRSLPTGQPRTNESISAEEIARLKAMGDSGPASGGPVWAEATPSKAQTRRETDLAIGRARAEQQAVTRQMYEVPKSSSQLADERREIEEAAYRRRTTERLMTQMEKQHPAATAPVGAAAGLPGAVIGRNLVGEVPLNLAEYTSIKAAYGNDPARIPDRIRQLFSREIALDESGKLPGSSRATATGDLPTGSEPGNTRILSTKEDVIPYKPTRNAFYGAGGQRRRPAGTASLGNLAVRAVVHGDADEVSVMAGTTVAIRLVDDLQLLLNGDVVFFPANTLLSGICAINGERVLISVSSIRRGSYLYEAALEAYDMDGRRGIRVPNLQTKTAASNVLAQTSQTVQPPFFLGNNQGAGQQIAAQMGIQAGQSVFQGVRNLILNKAQQVKVTIRPNYQILLRGANYANPIDSGRQSAVQSENTGNP